MAPHPWIDVACRGVPLSATSGTLPNPWRTPPPYLQDEEGALSPCR
jgi:hypothetical protein